MDNVIKKDKKIIKNIQKRNQKLDAIVQILDRQREYEPEGNINIFSGDDKKIKKQIYSDIYSLKCTNDFIIDKIKKGNTGTYAIFFNMNPLSSTAKKRLKVNISKIIYIFIDLDDANEEHNNLIKETLKQYNITYSYNAKTGHGYHFLIPVEIESIKENKVKSFLNFLKINICSKVDVATYTNERLLRSPESLHKKDDVDKRLITLHSHKPQKKEVELNSELILKYQAEQKKGKADKVYEQTIKKRMFFFQKF